MGRLFGTDGVRGLANAEITPELATALAVAAARVLAEADHSHRPVAVVGRDPRASGEMLEAATVAGLAAAGADVVRVGVLPTPAVAFLTAELNADLGVMLSASHNPMPDNGIKLFARGGHKLPDDVEDSIEALVLPGVNSGWDRPTGERIGRVRDLSDGGARYVEHLLAATPTHLDGLKLVVDCAHGAAYSVGPEAYSKAGAEVVAIGAAPDGLNINAGCGSNHPEALIAAVREHGADLGLAHDGDADRCVAVTAEGEIVDGDSILAICSLALRDRGELRQNTVVATVMSNLGFHHAMRDAGITVHTTPVGDRYILEQLRAEHLSLGGEQSGHVVFLDHATTGDGILTGLQLLSRMVTTGASLASLATVVERLPQVLHNVRVGDKQAVAASAAVAAAVRSAEAELGDNGRVLLRPSGTEQVVRVMVEAPTEEIAETVAARLSDVVASA